MKKLLLITTVLFLSIYSNSQVVTITETNQIPQHGDVVSYINAFASAFNPVGTGPDTNKLWNYTSIIDAGTEFEIWYSDATALPQFSIFPTSTIVRENSNESGYTFYETTSTEILRTGMYTDPQNIIVYDNPLLEFQFPISKGVSYSNPFSGELIMDIGVDSAKMDNGDLTVTADMQGTLILPNGTYTNVLRVHIQELFDLNMYIAGFPVYVGFMYMDTYYWYSDSIQDPILMYSRTYQDSVLNNESLRYQGKRNYNVCGTVYNDENFNCINDSSEGLRDILVYTNPGQYCAYTNINGFYQFELPLGNYTIHTVNPNLYGVDCPVAGFQTVSVTNVNDTITDLDIGISPEVYCPILNISVATGPLRPCFESIISIHYQNIGTLEATDPYIEIELDSNLSYIISSLPYTSVNGNIYTFELDTIDVFETGYITILVNVTCDVNLLGHTRCVNAEIFPQTECFPPDTLWDHSSLMVEGSCVGDSSACFIITNTGDFGNGDMESSQEYRIFANDTLVFTGSIQLLGQETIEICWPTNGRAIRLEADQHPLHPGNSHPQETIEDCGDYNGTSLGYITTSNYDDQDHFIDIFCNVITGSYDPNEKIVFPEGITDNHYIDNESELNYQINFQNTGTDTAFTVVVRDTLSDMHDITTLQNGVSSHPCTFTVYGQGILEWTFNNILLPDSNVNEPASHGFVTFKVKQKPLTSGDYGTHITNNAAIYFDFNPPVLTNSTDLIFWELPLVITESEIVESKYNTLKLYPNPTTGLITIKNEKLKIKNVAVFDIYGKEVLMQDVTLRDSKCELNLSQQAKGIYIIKVTTDRGVAIEKLILN